MDQRNVKQLLTDRFRCPEDVAEFTIAPNLSCDSGYFRFGSEAICYGQCSSGMPAKRVTDILHAAVQQVSTDAATVQLAFDPLQVVDNLRLERYPVTTTQGNLLRKGAIRNIYYSMRPFAPVSVRKQFQKMYFRRWDKLPFPTWPVDRTVENIHEQLLVLAMKSRNVSKVPFVWFWPDGARSCTIMTHDVETSSGVKFCPQLMDLNDSFGIKSSFQVVPEDRYDIPPSFLESIRKRGFEVNVHDLNHDGHLFSDRVKFLHRAEQINSYGQQWGAVGFRSAILYRNIDWYDALNFSYDMSIPNVAHLDPQRGGCCTVFPYFIGKILELPVTTTQDYSLFHMLNDYSTSLWKRQISLIQAKHGLISFVIHPDYIIPAKARSIYAELLDYLLKLRSQNETWIALPREVAAWWRLREKMDLINEGGCWRIEGEGSERAELAFAVLENDSIVYEVDRRAGKQRGFKRAGESSGRLPGASGVRPAE
jgi:hypothetical protein